MYSHCRSVCPGASRQFDMMVRDESRRFVKSAFPATLRVRPGWNKTWSRSVSVMLRFATVHYRCSFGDATVCPGMSRSRRYIGDRSPVLTGVSTASHGRRTWKPRCYPVAYKQQGSYCCNSKQGCRLQST